MFADILEYDTRTGAHRRIFRRTLDENATIWRGDHRFIDGEVFGVYASASGPFFFHRSDRYPLTRGRSRAVVRRGERNTFELWRDSERLVVFPYQPITDIGWDAYSTEEDMDLFVGLAASLERDSFWLSYTVAGTEAERAPLQGAAVEPADYLLVYDRHAGAYRECYRLVETYDVIQQFKDVDSWTGYAPKTMARVLEVALEVRYDSRQFVVAKAAGVDASEAESRVDASRGDHWIREYARGIGPVRGYRVVVARDADTTIHMDFDALEVARRYADDACSEFDYPNAVGIVYDADFREVGYGMNYAHIDHQERL